MKTRKIRRLVGLGATILMLVVLAATIDHRSAAQPQAKPSPEWAMNATIIEACSCPMFCQCYFNTKPAGHAGHGGPAGMAQHYCRFNMGYKVNKGSYGDVKLDGVMFWLAGDLGGDFSMGETEWVEVTFDPAVTKPQRDALATILGHVYPVKWKHFSVANDAKVDWQATKDRAVAKLADGKNGEIVLVRFQGMNDEPIVMRNVKYFGAPRNDGFIMMPNEVEAYRVGPKAFEYKGSNGFMITIDITSKDIKKA
jgi:hypothetical protein